MNTDLFMMDFDEDGRFNIYGERQTGKTVRLIEIAHELDAHIVALDIVRGAYTINKSLEFHLPIPPVFVLSKNDFIFILSYDERTHDIVKDKLHKNAFLCKYKDESIKVLVDDSNYNKYYDNLLEYNFDILGTVDVVNIAEDEKRYKNNSLLNI